ncbi:MAG: NAD(P)-dependent oxidoreductase [Selenomonadaceae bacterium]|nr:NAD(P)-dependent oxidoreductase [Selenomonadaceae bacterium]
MKILMTGITGFIGHHLGERLVNDGHEVVAIVRPTSKIDELSENLRRNVKFHVYDSENTVLDIVTDLCVEGNRPDVVYHLAANFLNAHQFDDIKFLIQSNITFGTELLDAMTANNVFNFVNVGTMYQHFEDAEYSPVNLYAATKECFESIIQFYVEARGLRCIALHLFDTYGADDKRVKIWSLLRKIAETGETLKMSPGGQLLDVVYIDDIVEAFVLAGEYLAANRYDYCGTYGVSSLNPIPLREVVKIFEEVAGKKLSIEWGGRPYRQREVMVPWKNFKTLPGWAPKINLRDGIGKLLGV